VAHLAQQGNGLEPAETLLDSLPLPLADAVACMTRRPLVEGTAAAPTVILRDMWRDLHVAALGDEISRVKAFVAAHGHPLRAGNLFQHRQRGIALRRPAGFPHHRIHDQAVPVLHQQIAAVAQLGLLALALAG